MRRAVTALALVVLAGCIAGGGPPASGPPNTEWAPGDGIDADALAETHWRELRAAGSFTHNRSSTYSVAGDTRPESPRPEWYATPGHTVESVDLDEGRYRRRSVREGVRLATTFVSPAVDATRRKPCTTAACSWEYDYTARSELDTVAGEIDRFRRDRVIEATQTVLDDWNYTFVAATRRDGHLRYRYAAEWTLDRPMHPFAEPPDGEGTLVVTTEGVVLEWAYRFTGPAAVPGTDGTRTVTVTRRHRITYRDVGATAVDRPAWVDVAREHEPTRRTRTGS